MITCILFSSPVLKVGPAWSVLVAWPGRIALAWPPWSCLGLHLGLGPAVCSVVVCLGMAVRQLGEEKAGEIKTLCLSDCLSVWVGGWMNGVQT